MIELFIKRSAQPITLGFLVVLLCGVCPLLASCQTTKKGNKPAKIAAPSRSAKQVRLEHVEDTADVPGIESLVNIDAKNVKKRAASHPPVFEDEAARLLDGYFRLRYYDILPSDIPIEVVFMIRIGHYVKGLRQGEWATQYVERQDGLDYTKTYKDGLEHGPLIVYKPDGQVLYQTTFENGNGMWKLFYPNTKLRLEGTLKGGRSHGVWRYYNEQGQLTKEELFENGELVPAK